jgi:short-subunit dehydrogenase
MNLKNQWILLTGASGGLGKHLARQLAQTANANLILSARNEKELLELQKELLSAAPIQVHIINADLAKDEDINRLFSEAIRLAPIIGLINNAGKTMYGESVSNCYEEYKQIFQVNFFAPLKLSICFHEYFEKNKVNGFIYNISSLAGLIALPYQNIYSASKHALQSFSESFCGERQKSQVYIGICAPGGINTDMVKKAGITDKIRINPLFYTEPKPLAKKIIKAIQKETYFFIPGFFNKLFYILSKMAPKKILSVFLNRIYRP